MGLGDFFRAIVGGPAARDDYGPNRKRLIGYAEDDPVSVQTFALMELYRSGLDPNSDEYRRRVMEILQFKKIDPECFLNGPPRAPEREGLRKARDGGWEVRLPPQLMDPLWAEMTDKEIQEAAAKAAEKATVFVWRKLPPCPAENPMGPLMWKRSVPKSQRYYEGYEDGSETRWVFVPDPKTKPDYILREAYTSEQIAWLVEVYGSFDRYWSGLPAPDLQRVRAMMGVFYYPSNTPKAQCAYAPSGFWPAAKRMATVVEDDRTPFEYEGNMEDYYERCPDGTLRLTVIVRQLEEMKARGEWGSEDWNRLVAVGGMHVPLDGVCPNEVGKADEAVWVELVKSRDAFLEAHEMAGLVS